MRWIKVLFFSGFLLTGVQVFAQERAIEPSSATDANVRIEKGNRAHATQPGSSDRALFFGKRSRAASGPREDQPRFKSKKKRAVNVAEGGSRVQTTNKRKQKRNNRMRLGGGE